MTSSHELDRPTLLLTELRRFIRLRWIAGGAIIVAATGHALSAGWSAAHGRVAAVGIAVLALNAVFRTLLPRPGAPPVAGKAQVWGQLLADLAALTLLVIWTGGLASPLLLAFVLHMVLASLLLPAPTAYAAAGAAAALVGAGLWLTDQLPATRVQAALLAAWALMLLLTVYLANHLSGGLRQREAELRRQHRRTRAILDTAADGIITIDERGTVQSVNPAAERIFGYPAQEIVGRNVRVLMPEPYRSEHDDYIAGYLRTGRARIIGIGREVAGRRRDGTVFPLELAVSEVALDDAGRLFTGIVRDVSERKAAEGQLRRLNQELLRQQEALIQHEKMAAMGQMAAGIAHEIGNPLASMDSLLQLLERHPDRMNPGRAAALRQQVERVSRLVRQMKDFSHPGEPVWETADLNELVESALDLVRFDQRARRVEIVRELDPDAGSVRVMPHTLQQVVLNLVLNALDAVVGAADPTITVATRRDGDARLIEVTDNGKGIEPEALPRIFEPFFTTKPLGRGTGLGLSISASLIERNHGRLDARSTPGRGSTFTVRLPPSGDREEIGRPIPASEKPAAE